MISPIMACYQHVLPIDFDDSISDYEALCKAYRKINEIIKYLENQENDFYNYVDQQISNLRTDINAKLQELYSQIQEDLEDNREYVDKEVQKLTNYVNTNIQNMQLQLNNAVSRLSSMIIDSEIRSKQYTDIQIQLLKDQIPELYNVHVISPVTGVIEPLQKVLDDMFNALRYNALTAWEYDSAGLTAERYDGLRISAHEYDMNGKYYIGNYISTWYMYSPFTGEWTYFKDVIYQLADLHRPSGLTATAYDALALTADAYDTLGLTAYNYDFSGIPA